MHARGRVGIARGEQLVRRLGAGVVDRRPALALAGRRRRRELERGQRGPEVEPGAADDDRRAAAREDLVDRRVREPLVLADRDVRRRAGTTPTSRAG